MTIKKSALYQLRESGKSVLAFYLIYLLVLVVLTVTVTAVTLSWLGVGGDVRRFLAVPRARRPRPGALSVTRLQILTKRRVFFLLLTRGTPAKRVHAYVYS